MYTGDKTTIINGPVEHAYRMTRHFIEGLQGIPSSDPQIVKVIYRRDTGYFGDSDASGMYLHRRSDEKAFIYAPRLHLDAEPPYSRMLLFEALDIDLLLIQGATDSMRAGSGDYELIFERYSDGTWSAKRRPIIPSRPRSVK